MRKFILATIAFILMQAASADRASAGELAEREAIRIAVAGLLHDERFADLETMGARYRRTQSRTSSGLWHLTLFYAGIAQAYYFGAEEEAAWAKAEAAAKRWAAAYPDSPTPHLALARLLVRRAWQYRGGGYAAEVNPWSWKPFKAYIEGARRHLKKHKHVASADPHWYELMAEVTKAQDWPEPRFAELIAEALEREPLFYQTYFAAIDYYSPKWGGSKEAIEAFARMALKITGSAEGFGMYARIYWYASQTQYGTRLFSESAVDWRTMKKGIDDVLRKYPDAWNINNFAKFACLSRDRRKTGELMARIGNTPVPAAWPSRSLMRACALWALGQPT